MNTVASALFGLLMLFGVIELLSVIAGVSLYLLKARFGKIWEEPYRDVIKFERAVRWGFLGSALALFLMALWLQS